ncbi:MAG: class I SAM-dependent methyltransferase [Planctomycetota bacterium]|nr:MAG: class I SAM-dependent methyltransferase [Planctomycetota bacterium]
MMLSYVDRLARRLVTKKFEGLRGGWISLEEPGGRTRLGADGPRAATLMVRSGAFYRRAVLGGSLGAAESYLRGEWDCDDLTGLFRLMARHETSAQALEGRWTRIAWLGQRLRHALRANTRAGSRRNIHEHYDLGNEFFGLWLDDTWAYSSGIFPAPGATLREASLEKFDRVCRRLHLQPRDHLLEIGCGWGGLAIHAAKHYGCRVTATTISAEQFALAARRIAAAGLGDRITLLDRDYRDLSGQFDKVASIEMIEAVGHRYLDGFFRQVGALLKPEGSVVLQAIVMPEYRYQQYLHSVDFIRRYVFPGGSLPSAAALLDSAGRTTRLRLAHSEDFAPHYAETLRRWRSNFHRHLAEVRSLGYDERFLRLWDYYLCYCEAAFEERAVGVVQMQLDNWQCRRNPLEVGLAAVPAPNCQPNIRPCVSPWETCRA